MEHAQGASDLRQAHHGGVQMAEAALADEWVRHGDRLALQRRVLRLGKPPRRWRKPPWAKQVPLTLSPKLGVPDLHQSLPAALPMLPLPTSS